MKRIIQCLDAYCRRKDPFLIFSSKAAGNINTNATAVNNSTGCKLIVISCNFALGANPILTDTTGNTYITEQRKDNLNGCIVMFYCINPITSANHVFTITGAGQYPSIMVYGFGGGGTITFGGGNGRTQAGGTFSTTTTNTLGGLLNKNIIVTGLNCNVGDLPFIVSDGLIQVSEIPPVTRGALNGTFSGGAAYKFNLSAPINPVWSWSLTTTETAANILGFNC